MHRKKLYSALLERVNEYKHNHMQTVEIDLRIAEALSKGSSIKRISIEMPCDISTIYRSIDRIEKFLQNEDDDINLLKASITISNAFITGRWSHRSLLGMKLCNCFIAVHQLGKNRIKGSEVKRYMPGLRNKKQRGAILEELSNLNVLTDEEEPKNIKIFEFVKYIDRNYFFELTEEAYPYCYPLYQLLGRQPQFINLCE